MLLSFELYFTRWEEDVVPSVPHCQTIFDSYLISATVNVLVSKRVWAELPPPAAVLLLHWFSNAWNLTASLDFLPNSCSTMSELRLNKWFLARQEDVQLETSLWTAKLTQKKKESKLLWSFITICIHNLLNYRPTNSKWPADEILLHHTHPYSEVSWWRSERCLQILDSYPCSLSSLDTHMHTLPKSNRKLCPSFYRFITNPPKIFGFTVVMVTNLSLPSCGTLVIPAPFKYWVCLLKKIVSQCGIAAVEGDGEKNFISST